LRPAFFKFSVGIRIPPDGELAPSAPIDRDNGLVANFSGLAMDLFERLLMQGGTTRTKLDAGIFCG
jgi:hypothetical protein